MNKSIFVTAIDTDAGKTIVTGLLALYFKSKGETVITQKIAQTGCVGISSDISKHREIMGEELNKFDKDGITCPYVFEFAASPHLSAKLENKKININNIAKATKKLERNYNKVIVEGVGGLMVPLNDDITVIEYIKKKKYPVILVSNSKLGSINHTLLSIDALKRKKINIIAVIFNEYPKNNDLIFNDTSLIIQKHLQLAYPNSIFLNLPHLDNSFNFDFKI